MGFEQGKEVESVEKLREPEREDEVIVDEGREGCEFRGRGKSKIDLNLTCAAP